jgi:hypothetical protein
MSKTQTQAPAAPVSIIADLKELDKAIGAAQKAHIKVDLQWQVLAVSAIAAFAAHGNVFYINKVWKSVGKGTRHAALTAFFTTFGGVSANKGENKDETPFVKDADKKPNLAEAQKTMWYDMAPSKAPDAVVDYLALILKAAKKSPKEGQAIEHDSFRKDVLELAQKYEATLAE